jgi:lysyl-tRNA synthetase, class II
VLPVLRIERHRLGARIYLLGIRLHEWHLGGAVMLALLVGAAAGLVHLTLTTMLAAGTGVWLIAKDWQDLIPSRRDTAAWRLGLHRRPQPLRALHRADPLPTVTALAAVLVAAINLASALTPNVAWRRHALLHVESIAALRVSHALAIPAAAMLLVTAFYLQRRRRRAAYFALALLLALGFLNLTKGLDFEEASVDFVAAALLWLGRGSFYVHHDPLTGRRALVRIPALVAGCVVAAATSVWIAAPAATSFGAIVRETGDLLVWQPGPLMFSDELARLDLAVGTLGVATIAVCAYLVFRPLAAPRSLPDAELRAAAVALVRTHGTDTLAYFKLRHDKQYLFSSDRRAFLGYRIENRVLLVSGDPVGHPGSIPSLLTELSAFAERRALHIAALGVSEGMRASFEQLGLRALYIGDEAVVDTEAFSLEGRAIRKVRQSVSRLENAGYRAEIHDFASIDDATTGELEAISRDWRQGATERGFSMTLDAMRRDDQGDTVIVVARDAEGRARGFLHFVPSYGRPAMSLSFMRRERDTPNGLTEFLVARSIELLRGRGIHEVSLNFAAFAQLIHSPRGHTQRLLGRLLGLADTFFQIESLYRFNAKFFPRWEPRYLLYESMLGLPRAGLTALWVEGQLPQPSLGGGKQRVPTS